MQHLLNWRLLLWRHLGNKFWEFCKLLVQDSWLCVASISRHAARSITLPALFYSSVNYTDALDWLSRWCGDEINRWRNKTTPFTARDVTIFITTSNFEIRNSLGYNISENACLNYRTTNICPFRQQKLLKITLLQLFQWKNALSSAMPKVGVSLCLLYFSTPEGWAWLNQWVTGERLMNLTTVSVTSTGK